jgi:23S rRNA (guanine745-N1)-methyltransferase
VPSCPPAPELTKSSSFRLQALDSALRYLRCPTCRQPLHRLDRRVLCPRGHTFDLARQGYLNLAVGSIHRGSADTSAMVLAREKFLSAGHYRPLADQLAAAAAQADPAVADGIVVDLAGGTGYYLAAALEALPNRPGLCLDLSAPALRRAATAHTRAAAAGADAWQHLPVASGSASTVLSAFGPRDPGEIDRILAPGGALIVLSPLTDHLHELIGPLGLLRVDPLKAERQGATFDRFRLIEQTALTYQLTLDHDDIAALAGMGPTARHASVQTLAARISAISNPAAVTVAVLITTYGADSPPAVAVAEASSP